MVNEGNATGRRGGSGTGRLNERKKVATGWGGGLI